MLTTRAVRWATLRAPVLAICGSRADVVALSLSVEAAVAGLALTSSKSIYIGLVMSSGRKPSSQTLIVLRALAAQPSAWRYGYDLTKETGLRPGTLYPLLIRLADQGVLEAEWRPSPHPGRPARHAYRLTSTGVALARAERADETASLPKGCAPA